MSLRPKPRLNPSSVRADNESAPSPTAFRRHSASPEFGFQDTITTLQQKIRELYVADSMPWIIGYSGGKDSTATLQLIWGAIAELSPDQCRKTIHVISTDTLVENPVVAAWVESSLKVMRHAAEEHAMPVAPRLLRPKLEDSFWVNLSAQTPDYPGPWFIPRSRPGVMTTCGSQSLGPRQPGSAQYVCGCIGGW